MQDELEDHQEDYFSLTYEDWCDLLSIIEVNANRKGAATQINKIAFDKSASLSNSNKSFNITRKKKARTGVLCSNKRPNRKSPKYNGTHYHYVLCKN